MGMISILAKSRLRYYKSRTILTMIAIFLTTMLLNGIVVFTIGLVDMNRQAATMNGRQHAAFIDITGEQKQMLANHLEVEELAVIEIAAEIEYEKLQGDLLHGETVRGGDIDSDGEALEGHLPETSDEICGSESFFKRMGVEPKIGNRISITFRPKSLNGLGEMQTKTFTICGLYPGVDVTSLGVADSRIVWSAYVSEAFVQEIMPQEDRAYRAMFRLYGEEGSDYEEMVARIKALAEEIGVPKQHVSLNQDYLYMMLTPPVETIEIAGVIAVLVVCFAMLAIYSIYYVNVITDIQEIGKLKALGAGDRQIRRLFLREGVFCSLIAVPSGLLAGFLILYIAWPYIIEWVTGRNVFLQDGFMKPNLFSLPLTVLVAVVIFAAVFLSLIKPIRAAGKVSPITAIRYQENSTSQKFRKGYRQIGAAKICLANLSRNKKRTTVTMLAMGLSWVLFMGVSGILSSLKPEGFLEDRLFDGARFQIYLDTEMEDRVYPENAVNHVQMQNLLGEEVIEEIRNLDGVEGVRRWKEILARVEKSVPDVFMGQDNNLVIVGTVDKDRAEKYGEKLQRGRIDYEEMTEENGIIFCYDAMMDETGLSVGDQVNLTLYDGDREIPFTGKLVASIDFAVGEDFLITEETYQRLGFETDTATSLMIYMEEPTSGPAYESRYGALKEALTEIVGAGEKMYLVSWDEELRMGRMIVASIVYPLTALLILIAVISMMSMINTMVTSITTRKRELGMLQAVGLSDRQLVRMLSGEGLFFTAGTLILSFTVGNALGYWLYEWAKEEDFARISSYHYPVMQTVFLCIAMVVGQLFIVFFLKKRIGRESMIDRIRSGE